jgi:hypothetical protein
LNASTTALEDADVGDDVDDSQRYDNRTVVVLVPLIIISIMLMVDPTTIAIETNCT